MVIGPNAPLVFDLYRATHMTGTHYFYKPNPSSLLMVNYHYKLIFQLLTNVVKHI